MAADASDGPQAAKGPTLASSPCHLRMRVLVNGDWNEIEEGETLESLLARLGLDRRRVAVEHNHQIVPRIRYGETRLGEGDRLEIVHFVGGG